MAKKPAPPKRMVSLRLSEALITRVEAFAERHHRYMTTVVEMALAEYLDRYGHIPPIEESAKRK